jgi:hypothetical protein
LEEKEKKSKEQRAIFQQPRYCNSSSARGSMFILAIFTHTFRLTMARKNQGNHSATSQKKKPARRRRLKEGADLQSGRPRQRKRKTSGERKSFSRATTQTHPAPKVSPATDCSTEKAQRT